MQTLCSLILCYYTLWGLVLECEENGLREREGGRDWVNTNLTILSYWDTLLVCPILFGTVFSVCRLHFYILQLLVFVSENVSPPSGMEVLHLYRMCMMLSFRWALSPFSGHFKFDLDFYRPWIWAAWFHSVEVFSKYNKYKTGAWMTNIQ